MLCQHCNNEHMVRRDGGAISLEAYARCPQCGRNDRVEKVSSIIRSHSQEITKTEQRIETYLDKDGNQKTRTIEVPITEIQATGLARSFVPPDDLPEPIPKPKRLPKPKSLPKPRIKIPKSIRNKRLFTGLGIGVLIFSCLLFFGSIGIIITAPILENVLCCGSITVFFFIIGILLIVYRLVMKLPSEEEIAALEKEKTPF